MDFSPAALHPPVLSTSAEKAAAQDEFRKRARLPLVLPLSAAAAPGVLTIPLTTVSLNANFDAYINIAFKGSVPGAAVALLVDSGNSMLIVPRWEDIEALPNGAHDYSVLGSAQEPWGCPAKIVRGPIQLFTLDGSLLTLPGCVFYACTGDGPEGTRTANFGAGCLSPWSASAWNTPSGTDVPMKAPLAYLSEYPYAELAYAPAAQIHGPAAMLTIATGSYLKLCCSKPADYQLLRIIPDLDWMSLVPQALSIADRQTDWPGAASAPIAMIDSGGGPVFLSDPSGYVYPQTWPDPVPNPGWTSGSQACASVSDRLEIELGDDAGKLTYTLDAAHWPQSVRGLTLVMCQMNEYMRGQQGMNIGGISVLVNTLLIDYAHARVGLKPK